MVAGLDEIPFTPRCWEDAVGLFEDSSSTSPILKRFQRGQDRSVGKNFPIT